MKQIGKYFLFAVVFAMTLTSCEKDDPVVPNEEELITTLTYTLTPAGGGAPVVLRFVDLDGDGGAAPTITGGAITANETYAGSITLMNESENPAENITEEVQEEAEEHQFFFNTTLSGLSLAYTDQDANGNPIGLETSLTAATAGSGNFTIILRHEPNKTADGVAMGNIANAGGETDIEVTFALDVQ